MADSQPVIPPTVPVSPAPATPAQTTTAQTTVPTHTAPIATGSLLSQVGSMLVGVLLLILAIAWVVRKLGLTPPVKHNKLVKVVSSCQVGQRERVVVVEIDNTWLVLGVTPQQITQLHSLSAKEISDTSPTEGIKPVDFRQIFNKVVKRPEKSE